MHCFCRIFVLAGLFLPFVASAQLKTPDEFLPHRLGEQFTLHHTLLAYFEHVATNSPRVKWVKYGETPQGRPMMVAVISTPENLARLEEIRLNHLRRAGISEGKPDPTLDRVIVGLGFTVHGNEAAGTESSMAVVHFLADPANAQSGAWLNNTIVLLDPVQNPDGFARYTNWYRDIAPSTPDPRREAREHREPWPGGRPNHYLFDLNRDWAWQTQPESRQRAVFYHQWLPHVFADIHEQGYNEPYYFAPAARPYHQYITDWQRAFQVQIGQNHARYFDQEGWLYFTKERFDLLYPSYGDTYPTYLGSIGMTYEQGGIGAGRAILIENGDTLTLFDRVAHHQTAAISTVEVASRHAGDLIRNFQAFYERSRQNPPGPYKAYIVKANNVPGKLDAFTQQLQRNGIRFGKAGKSASLKGFDYLNGTETTVRLEANDLVISAFQPAGTLAQILLDPQPTLEDSLTYDITAWSLLFAHGLESYAVREKVEPQEPWTSTYVAPSLPSKPYAYIVRWQSMNDARFLAALAVAGVQARFARQPFRTEGRDYAAGTLVITRADNRLSGESFDAVVSDLARKHRVDIAGVRGGMVESGMDFGSSEYPMAIQPRVAVLFGEGTYSNAYGQVWHFMEQDLGYPFAALPAQNIASLDLSEYDVLILCDGNYRLDESAAHRLGDWVSKGGRIIAIGSALSAFEDRSGFSLPRQGSGDAKPKGDSGHDATTDSRLLPYGNQDRRAISEEIPGAVFKIKMDTTHPLAFGYTDAYHSLKTGAQSYPWLKNGWNVGYLESALSTYGFVGEKALAKSKNSVVFAVEDKGYGKVIYLVDNPLFRGFWENGKLLFSNALFLTTE